MLEIDTDRMEITKPDTFNSRKRIGYITTIKQKIDKTENVATEITSRPKEKVAFVTELVRLMDIHNR